MHHTIVLKQILRKEGHDKRMKLTTARYKAWHHGDIDDAKHDGNDDSIIYFGTEDNDAGWQWRQPDNMMMSRGPTYCLYVYSQMVGRANEHSMWKVLNKNLWNLGQTLHGQYLWCSYYIPVPVVLGGPCPALPITRQKNYTNFFKKQRKTRFLVLL